LSTEGGLMDKFGEAGTGVVSERRGPRFADELGRRAVRAPPASAAMKNRVVFIDGPCERKREVPARDEKDRQGVRSRGEGSSTDVNTSWKWTTSNIHGR